MLDSPNYVDMGSTRSSSTKNKNNYLRKSNIKGIMPQYHVLFSTGCSDQQDWESYVFFYHAMRVQQPGNITRLVSGCDVEQQKRLSKFHYETIYLGMSKRFHIHFTPEYGKSDPIFKNEYKYNNKPNSLHHWMVHVLHMNDTYPPINHTSTTTTHDGHANVENDIILLLDPDMILLRPLLHDFSNQPNTIYANKSVSATSKFVHHGNPISQQDAYLSNEWMDFNFSRITDGGTSPKNFRQQHGGLFYNSGPPYLGTVKDWWSLVNSWKEYVPRVYEEHPKIFAEMYGLVIATTQLQLPNTLIKSIVVSTTFADQREGWPLIDSLPDDQLCTVASDAVSVTINSTAWDDDDDDDDETPFRTDLPIILHYCRRYLLGKFFFSKYRLKKKFISCKVPLLTIPPHDSAGRYDYWIRPPPDRGTSHEDETRKISKRQARRETFMLCGLLSAMNEASRYYKDHHCDVGEGVGTNNQANYSETYNFFDDPYSRDLPSPQSTPKKNTARNN